LVVFTLATDYAITMSPHHEQADGKTRHDEQRRKTARPYPHDRQGEQEHQRQQAGDQHSRVVFHHGDYLLRYEF